jgi:hypothetical protein
MSDFFAQFFEDLDPIAWLFIWALLILIPLGSLALGVHGLRKVGLKEASLVLVFGVLTTAAVAWLLADHGTQMWALTIESGAGWIKGVLVGGTICILLLPFGWVGSKLRYALQYKLKGYRGERVRRSAVAGLVGLAVIVGIGFVIFLYANSEIFLGYSFVSGLMMVIGALGYRLIPEELEDFVEDD